VWGVLQIWTKGGQALVAPRDFSQLWERAGGVCAQAESEQMSVLYDHLARRWVLLQLQFAPATTACVAISQSTDPGQHWYLYSFQLDSDPGRVYDNPRLALWPDGYYLSTTLYDPKRSSTTSYLGEVPLVFDRAAMLAGRVATVQAGRTLSPQVGPLLPATLDGPMPPAAGAPALFAALGEGLDLYHFRVDWAIPANTVFTPTTTLAVAPFVELCPGTRDCVPQPDEERANLDGGGDRLAGRLAYRQFADHATLIATHTVGVGPWIPSAAIRW
jgi:hypothetical protein